MSNIIDTTVSTITFMSKMHMLLLSTLGIANIVGCVGVIVTSRLPYDRLNLHFASTMIYATATVITAFSTDKVIHKYFLNYVILSKEYYYNVHFIGKERKIQCYLYC